MRLISIQTGFITNSSTYIVAAYLDNAKLIKFLDEEYRKQIASKIYDEVLDILAHLESVDAIAEGDCDSITQTDIENALQELAERYIFDKYKIDRPIRFLSYYRSIGVDGDAEWGECRNYILPAVIIALSRIKHESIVNSDIELSY